MTLDKERFGYFFRGLRKLLTAAREALLKAWFQTLWSTLE